MKIKPVALRIVAQAPDLDWCRANIPGFAKAADQVARAERERLAHNAEHDTGRRPTSKEPA